MSTIQLDNRVWFIVCPDNGGIVYSAPARSAKLAWDEYEKSAMGECMTVARARALGYRAKRCVVLLPVNLIRKEPT